MTAAPRGLATWTPEQRFWRNVQQTNTCWLWRGAKTLTGYGHLTVDGKRKYAHRFSYELHNKMLCNKEVVCHRCDNPSCVNPEHLFAGSIADNNRDMWSKGRGRGLDPHNGKLTDADRRAAVALVAAGHTKTEVANRFGVTRQAVGYLIKAGIYA